MWRRDRIRKAKCTGRARKVRILAFRAVLLVACALSGRAPHSHPPPSGVVLDLSTQFVLHTIANMSGVDTTPFSFEETKQMADQILAMTK